jgi:hypothetical protein
MPLLFCDGTIEIPQLEPNIQIFSVSAGIVVWDIFRKMQQL